MDRTEWNRRYAGDDFVWTSQANRFLVQETAVLAPGRAIDLACGEGRNAVWLAGRGWEVTGVDFAKVGLQKARRLAQARGAAVEWIEADLLEYRLDPQAFDLVLVFYLQVPEDQRTSIVRGAADGVASDGVLLLVGHDTSNIELGHGGPQNPAVLYSAHDVAGDLNGSGLKIERAERVQRPVQTPDGERIALDALVRARRPGSVSG